MALDSGAKVDRGSVVANGLLGVTDVEHASRAMVDKVTTKNRLTAIKYFSYQHRSISCDQLLYYETVTSCRERSGYAATSWHQRNGHRS